VGRADDIVVVRGSTFGPATCRPESTSVTAQSCKTRRATRPGRPWVPICLMWGNWEIFAWRLVPKKGFSHLCRVS